MANGYTTVAIEILNHSTVIGDVEVQSIVGALTAQLNGTFAKVWELGMTTMRLVPKGMSPIVGRPTLSFFDDADQAGALGYHDMGPDGEPLGKIFVKTTLADGSKVSTCASHEACEMRKNPFLTECVQMNDTDFTALEVSDAPEADRFGYLVNGILMSDFVYPSFFDVNGKPPYDRMGHIMAPFQILAGGYMSIWTPGRGWQQRNGASLIPGRMGLRAAYAALPRIGSRRERIHRGPLDRIPSVFATTKEETK